MILLNPRVILVFVLTLASLSIWWIQRFVVSIPIRFSVPVSLLEKCDPQNISVLAKVGNREMEATVSIKGFRKSFCIVEYIAPGGVAAVSTHTFAYNSSGNLCGYYDFFTRIEESELFCRYRSL